MISCVNNIYSFTCGLSRKKLSVFAREYGKINTNLVYYGYIMIDYMKKHESYVHEVLAKNPDEEKLKELLAYHDKQIQWMQHERLVHLIVLLFVCSFTLLIFGLTLIQTSIPSIILFVILLILSFAYVIHYYRLENGVQKWYEISNEIKRRL